MQSSHLGADWVRPGTWKRLQPSSVEPEVHVRVRWVDGWREGTVTHVSGKGRGAGVELSGGKGYLMVETLAALLARNRRKLNKEEK